MQKACIPQHLGVSYGTLVPGRAALRKPEPAVNRPPGYSVKSKAAVRSVGPILHANETAPRSGPRSASVFRALIWVSSEEI